MKSYFVAAAMLLTPLPALAQESFGGDSDPSVSTGFSGLYVGAAGGYDVQGNDGGSRILFDRNLDGTYGGVNDIIRTPTGVDAFSPGFCGGAARNTPAGSATAGRGPTNGGPGCRRDRDGGAYYARVGFDHQQGQIVYGLVGEFGRTHINDSVSGFSTTPANYVMYREVSWEAGIRARAGYTPNDSTLFYGTFGPGYARINRDYFSTNTANTVAERGRRNQFGFQGGGGIEQRFGDHFSVGLEYLFHQYQDDNYRVRLAGPAGTPFTNADTGGSAAGTDLRRSDDKFRWHSMRATAAFRF